MDSFSEAFKKALNPFRSAARDERDRLQELYDDENEKEEVDDDKLNDLNSAIDILESTLDAFIGI